MEHFERTPGDLAVHRMVVEQIAGDQEEIELAVLRQTLRMNEERVEGLKSRFPNMARRLWVETRDAQAKVQIGGVEERNHWWFQLRENVGWQPPTWYLVQVRLQGEWAKRSAAGRDGH
jgi:hypothetical protein